MSEKQDKTENVESEWVHLTQVANEIEYGMVSSLLEMGNIPIVRRVKGIDSFLEVVMGAPLAGIEVLVHRDRYEEAYQLLNSSVEEDVLEEEEKQSEG